MINKGLVLLHYMYACNDTRATMVFKVLYTNAIGVI